MKIAILTLSLYANYGGNLQAYALLKLLRDLGHDSWYLNRERHKKSLFNSFPGILRRSIRFCLGNRNQYILYSNEKNVVASNSNLFIEKYITPKTQEFLSSAQLKRKINSYHFDAFVVGSDQVWRRDYIKKNMSDYFLDFVDHHSKKISYAASFGIDHWDYTQQETDLISRLSKSFNAISVRESSAVRLVHDHMNMKSTHVLDPTLLLLRADYLKIIPEGIARRTGIMYYFLDPNIKKDSFLSYISNLKKLPCFSANGTASLKTLPPNERVAPSVESWLAGFRDADFVITDSFHGVVFCILFNKNFIAYGNKSRGLTRFESLLQTFNLTANLVTDETNLEQFAIPTIEWKNVNRILELERSKSINFLVNSLS